MAGPYDNDNEPSGGEFQH